MRKIIFFAAMLFAVSVSAQVNIANGLLAYYPYNGNANDESGNGYNGTVGAGVTLSTDRFGVQNKAYDFQNGAITGTFVPYDLDSNYTITAWFNTSATNHNRLFLWSDNPAMKKKYTAAGLNRVSSVFVEGYFSTNETSCGGINDNIAFMPSSPSPNPYLDGQWHMLTLTRNNNLLSLYVDSVFIDDENIVDNCTQIQGLLTDDFHMGSIPSQFVTFIGKLDDVMIHTRVLNTAEISYLYNLNSSWSSPTSTEVISENELRLFPNPVKNTLNIQLSENSNYALEVTDLNGKRVYSSNLSGQNFELNTAEWAQGLYLLRLIDENGKTYTQKVVKD
jgi:hypothetical protein